MAIKKKNKTAKYGCLKRTNEKDITRYLVDILGIPSQENMILEKVDEYNFNIYYQKNKKRKREENKDENKSIKKLRRTSVYDRRWEEQTENEINFPDKELSLMEFIEPMEEEDDGEDKDFQFKDE